MIPFNIIVAIDEKNGIGKNGKLPWHVPEDLKHFKAVTCRVELPSKRNAVVMGRKTWESIPGQFRPLSDRFNIVITRNKELALPDSVLKAESFQSALDQLEAPELSGQIEDIYVIGGQQVYREAIGHPQCRQIYLTHILASFNCDAFFPPFEYQFEKKSSSSISQSGSLQYYFAEYIPKK